MQGDILRSKPNANVDTIGTIIMIKQNHLSEYLKNYQKPKGKKCGIQLEN